MKSSRLYADRVVKFFTNEYAMMYRMSNVLYCISRIVLLAAIFVSGSGGLADGAEFRFTSKEHRFNRLPIREWLPQSARKKPVRASGRFSDDEVQLYNMLMDYRRSHGQYSIPLSPSLSRVARLHVRDLEAHPPSGACNLHSWSKYGPWQPVCYNGSQSVELMWSKPRELTDYSGNGYEIAAWTSGCMLPDLAMNLWEGSSSHDAVILNSGNWERLRWKAVGLAISGSYAVVWFGEESDI
jgi:hypothetical protein